MPNIAVLDMAGKNVGEITLSDAIFGITPNAVVMHAAVINYLANQRQGTQSTLTRTEVSGGGKKPWRQKGTGHARQGSTRAPQWRHGGVALGPKPRDYSYSLNKKVRQLALKSALSDKVLSESLIVLDEFFYPSTCPYIIIRYNRGYYSLPCLKIIRDIIHNTSRKNCSIKDCSENFFGSFLRCIRTVIEVY